ncbi:MSHA biogenesis protein MshP [Shewanella avicenniae]|uniref:MSHA biogenesis protein MshP n=1 Tax=Shewanella avicenniae TaxID=2814294 RepID=A0ABX7QQP1_9GAMM|nr:MSHA biogenesis protein MshP [Shewanella avicenniae]QSX33236.1 MSHA biogenesis protein MshP [Shewanella avicenniae]
MSRNKHFQLRLINTQKGSALMIALFIIVVIAVLAASLIRIGTDADEGVNLEVWSLRAFNAANSGADAALAQLFPLNGGTVSCSNVASTWTPPNVTGFHGCDSITLSCTAFTVGTAHLYRITSHAVCQTGNCDSGTVDERQCLRVSRSVEVEARE